MSDPLAGEELTVDGLTRDWTLTQRRRGHRHSTDDLLTGWYAAEKGPVERRALLDLGSGVGSVGLLALFRSPGARLVAVEAQEVSYALLVRNVEGNGLAGRVVAIHGDLRSVDLGGERFDLVTGSPPYFDVRAGVVPADSQKAHARFELRGDVRDYCARARASLAPGGVFVFCLPTVQRERAERAVRDAGLALVASRDVIPREGASPLFSLYACRLASEHDAAPVLEPPHVVRDREARVTEAHEAVRASFGLA